MEGLIRQIQDTAFLANESYDHSSEIRGNHFNGKNGFRSKRLELNGHEEFCDLYENKSREEIYVVFMGTDSRSQWLGNFLGQIAFIWNWDMSNMAESFSDKIVRHVKENYSSEFKYKYFISGHSRGAALAVYTAQHMAQLGENVKCVITFGGMKVSNSMKEPLPFSVYRIVHVADGAPSLPYFCKHVGGKEIQFGHVTDFGDDIGIGKKAGPHSILTYLSFANNVLNETHVQKWFS
jgi:hypothetical protein